jgi:hypothetical protein
MKDPSNHSEWIGAARQRALDAKTLLSRAEHSVGPVYMAGYALECSFKGLLLLRRENIPKGKEGHNLMNLRSLCNLHWSGIEDKDGLKAAFLDMWTVDLRYQWDMVDLGHSYEDLVGAAQIFCGYIQKIVLREEYNQSARGKGR